MHNEHALSAQIKETHWDLQMLLTLGVDEKWLVESNPSPKQLNDLVKGLLYLKAKYPQFYG